MTKWVSCLLAVAALGLGPGFASAEADGPDFFAVTAVQADDVLNIRGGPRAQAPKLGEIPADGVCIRNLGCQGGLTLQEFNELSEAQKAKRLREHPRWCKVEYRGVIGWVAGRYLRERDCNR